MPRRGFEALLAWTIAGAWLAVIDAVLGPALAWPPSASLLLRRTFAGVGTLLALGLALGAPVAVGAALLERLRAPVVAGLIAYAAAGAGLAYLVMERVLWRQADSAFDGTAATPLFVLFVIVLGMAPMLVHAFGAIAATKRRIGLLALVVALGTAVGNHLAFRDDYAEIHAVVGTCAGLLAGAVLAAWSLPPLAARPRAALILAAVVSALALAPVFGGVSNDTRKQLFRSPGAAGAWALAMTRWQVEGMPPGQAPERGARFFRAPRPGDPDVPPTSPPLAEVGPPVVLFVTIDAVRADALEDRSRDDTWPTLARLRDGSAHFLTARSPGSQTAVSLTAAFSGRTFSELFWAKYGRGKTRFEYAAGDPTPRFPSLLGAAGVDTFKVVGTNFLADEFGTAAGFARQVLASTGRRHARARDIEGPLLEALHATGRRPTFLYAHFMEPHAPYDRGAKRSGPKKERWLSEIAALDPTFSRLLAVLDGPRLRGRSWIIVSSDHGEAFGEHDSWEHTKTLYEEMIRVPLLVRGPGVVPRTVVEPVSLLDVGPTVLDLFAQPTPAGWAGQSLVPLLRPARPARGPAAGNDDAPGGPSAEPLLERPILAEGRMRQTLITPEGMKVIVDNRRKIVEAYDLAEDPGELVDVWDRPPGDPARERARVAAAALVAYYAEREARAPGYAPVYKP